MTDGRNLYFALQLFILVGAIALLYWAFEFGHSTKRNVIAASAALVSLLVLVFVMLHPTGVLLLLATTYGAGLAVGASALWSISLRRRRREKARSVP